MSDTEQKTVFRRHGKGGEDVDDKFDVELPKKAIAPLIVIAVVLIFGQYYYIQDILSVVILLVVTIIPVLLWIGLGPKMAEKGILKWLRRVSGKKSTRVDQIFLGFPTTKDLYFIEANSMDLKMGNFTQVVMRIKEVVFLSIGICILTAKILLPFFFDNLQAYWTDVQGDPYTGSNEFIFDTAIYLGPFALLVLFSVIPMFWIGEDMQIYRVDKLQDIKRVGKYLRSGLLSKLLGFFGIILAYDTAKGYANDIHGIDASMTAIYTTTFVQFGLILFACAGAPFIVAVIYLLWYHEIWVNNVRIKASDFLPSATVEVVTVPPNELELLTHPEKLRENQDKIVKFFSTVSGKILLVILLLIGIAVCFFMGFIFTGIWSEPIYNP